MGDWQAGELLRIATAGSVDDGKSTLIGRLLYDSKSVFTDQMDAIERTSADRGDDYTNLALLTDGLRAEREQGITIDVAYRYFATPRRTFIVADTPGHVQYTRNMVTGASTADVAIVLVDARKGVIEQSHRHAYLASLLCVPHIVLAVNKMDLVDYQQSVFDAIAADFQTFVASLGRSAVLAVPMAALQGDNVVERSTAMPWYDGPALLELLEDIELTRDHNRTDARFPVQYVIRPMSTERPDYRGYAGVVSSGVFRPGDAVTVLPSGRETIVEGIDCYDQQLDAAFAPLSVTLRLVHDVDVSRGDMIVASDDVPTVAHELTADVCWMVDAPLRAGSRYSIKHTTRSIKAMVTTIEYRVDTTSLEQVETDQLTLNDIGRVSFRLAAPLFVDDYAHNRATGSFIVIDEATKSTVGAGMIRIA